MSGLLDWNDLFVEAPRPLAAQRTMFTILSTCSPSFFAEITEAELSSKIFQTSSSLWGEVSLAKVLQGTARKRKPDFPERLNKVDEAGVSFNNMVEQ
jgi:hypothetical protein